MIFTTATKSTTPRQRRSASGGNRCDPSHDPNVAPTTPTARAGQNASIEANVMLPRASKPAAEFKTMSTAASRR